MSTSVSTAELTDEQLQALVEVMLAVVYGDGDLGDAERATLQGYLSRLGNADFDRTRTDPLLLAASLRLEREGAAARLRAAKAVLVGDEAKRVAIRLAFGAAKADGLEARERAALHAAAAALGLDAGFVEQLERE